MLVKCVCCVLDSHRICGTDILSQTHPSTQSYQEPTTKCHLVPRGRMCGAVPQLSRMSSWHEAFILCIVLI